MFVSSRGFLFGTLLRTYVSPTMSIQHSTDRVAKKFRGCMLGGLLGDCIGEPFEVEISDAPGHCIPLGKFTEGPTTVKQFLATLLNDCPENRSNSLLDYTDDTAMALSVGKSLAEKGMYDPNDMAKKFVDEYFLRPHKGYGSAVTHIFRALKKNGCQDIFGPAKNQFNGSGSYGNGAAMRVAPVALFGYKDEDLIKQVAESSSQITHTHQHGYNGAILQALAVHQALLSDTSIDFNPVQFVDTLLEKMDKIEKEISMPGSPESKRPYCKSLQQMKQIFEKQPVNVTPDEAAKIFGNHVSAQKSVPAAVFSFLRGFQPLDDFESNNPFVRTLYFAIKMGGDTDTIGCMAGNIAGAYHGESVIPDNLIRKCNAAEELKNLGDQLFELSQRRISKT